MNNSNNLANLTKDLTCPITHQLFEDPIIVPCCGKAFSKRAIVAYFKYDTACPLCNANLFTFNVADAIINTQLAGAVESLQSLLNPKSNSTTQKWSAVLNPISNSFGELKISLENSKFVTKSCLSIWVLDRSGSMAGNPWKQVQSALIHILSLARSRDHVKIVLIAYNSISEIINVPEAEDAMVQTINCLQSGGGTNFTSAFDKIIEVINTMKNMDSITVSFLTDGQDQSNDRVTLVNNFKNKLTEINSDKENNKSNNKSITVHSIGFSNDCDKDFLENLRKAGTQEGTFRYAEPGESDDNLCSKLTNLFDVSSSSSCVPVSLKLINSEFKMKNGLSNNADIQFPIGQTKKGSWSGWIFYNNNIKLILNSSSDKDIEIPVVINNDTNNTNGVLNKWFSLIADEIAAELLDLSANIKKYTPNIQELHFRLLEQRMNKIMLNVVGDPNLLSRYEYLNKELSTLQMGGSVNMGRLSDNRFGSQFNKNTNITVKNINSNVNTNIKKIDIKPYNSEIHVRYSRNNKDKNRSKLQSSIMDNLFNKITDEIKSNLDAETDINYQDSDGNTALLLASYCGQSFVVDEILSRFPKIDLNHKNNDGETVITLAVKSRGFWKSLKSLLEKGGMIPNERLADLEKYTIDNKYIKTAEIISTFKDDNVEINDTMSVDQIMFVYNKAIIKKINIDVDNYLKICISKCAIDMVNILITKHNAVLHFDSLFDLFVPDDPNYLKLFSLILDNLRHKDQNFNIDQTNENGDSLLFRACEKGCIEYVKLLLFLKSNINLQNSLGNTPLWIACYKKYLNIIIFLLDADADVNLENYKGNAPISCICQKGTKEIAEILLSRGAEINKLNKNGDSLILLCCRNGQSEVLELLLFQSDPDLIKHKAHIDGFFPLIASTEANRPECIKVLSNFGVDIEEKTDDTNEILAGATALHLAAYYGRFDAAKTLIELGANVNAKEIHGQTPLHIAIIQGNVNIIKLLIDKKADPFIKDNNNNVPVSYIRTDQVEIKKILINPVLNILLKLARGEFTKEEMASATHLLTYNSEVVPIFNKKELVNIGESDGTTLLMTAIINSNFDVAKLFLEAGADPTIKNVFGMSAISWSLWINNQRIKKLLGLDNNNNTVQEIDNLKKAATNTQNASILYLGINKNKHEDIIGSIHARMSDFINNVADHQAVILGSKAESDGSFLEFINIKEYSNLLWTSKIFTINTIASGNTLLDPAHVLSLYLYTGSNTLSNMINKSIMDNQKHGLDNFIRKFNDALNILPNYDGEVYVGAPNVLDRSKFLVGSNICWSTYLSGSTMWKIAIENTKELITQKKQGTIFIIKSKTGKLVNQYSPVTYESEVIMPLSAKYQVANWYHCHDVICLGQPNIRYHTFRVKPEDLDKMKNSNISLAIELQEI